MDLTPGLPGRCWPGSAPLRLFVAAVTVMILLANSDAQAAAPRVALWLSGPADRQRMEIETRLRAELAIAGFESTILDESISSDRESLERAARSSGSFAAIAVVRRAGLDADMWVADRVTGKTAFRRVRFDAQSADAAAIFAIRAVELLRASLLELTELHPSRGELAPTDKMRDWIAPTHAKAPAATTYEVHVGAAAVAGPGGIPAGGALALGFSWKPLPWWAGCIEGWGPVIGHVGNREGTATIDQEAALVLARLEPLRSPAVEPFGRLGVGAYHLGAEGHASPPYDGRYGQVWAAVGAVGLGLRSSGLRPLSIMASLDALFLAPRPGVKFANETIAVGGRPTLVGQIGVGLEW